MPQSGGKNDDTTTLEPAKTQEISKIPETAPTTATPGPSGPVPTPPAPTVTEPSEEIGSEPALDEEDQIFLERLAAIASEPEGCTAATDATDRSDG